MRVIEEASRPIVWEDKKKPKKSVFVREVSVGVLLEEHVTACGVRRWTWLRVAEGRWKGVRARRVMLPHLRRRKMPQRVFSALI